MRMTLDLPAHWLLGPTPPALTTPPGGQYAPRSMPASGQALRGASDVAVRDDNHGAYVWGGWPGGKLA